MIYSLTSFSGLPTEPEILKVRLAEELPFVDHFLIIEGDRTFSGKPKGKYYIDSHKHIWDDPKVTVIRYKYTAVNRRDTWRNAEAQRNAMPTMYDDDDVIIWSDLDEINCAEEMPMIIEQARQLQYARISIINHCYFINYFGDSDLWHRLTTSFVVTGKYLRNSHMSLHQLRKEWSSATMKLRAGPPMPRPDGRTDVVEADRTVVPVIHTHGHHFDYMLTPVQIAAKFEWLAASCYDDPKFKDISYLTAARENGWDVLQRRFKERVWSPRPMDATYPKSVLNNMAYWQRHVWKDKA